MGRETPYNNMKTKIRKTIRKAKRAITAYVIKQYYKEFDAEAYNIYYGQHNEVLREQVASNFIEFDANSFDNMPTYK